MNDPVTKPAHYTDSKIECIEAIEASCTPEEFQGWLKGNILKYVWRWRKKGGAQDLGKALFYLDRLHKAAKHAENIKNLADALNESKQHKEDLAKGGFIAPFGAFPDTGLIPPPGDVVPGYGFPNPTVDGLTGWALTPAGSGKAGSRA